MKLNLATATLILAAVSHVAASPAAASLPGTTVLTQREINTANHAIASLNSFNKKRSLMTNEEIAKRESQIVTDVLAAIKDTNLAPGIIKYFINDPTLTKIATDVIVTAIKSGWINLSTLLKSLNDSGLAVDVIQNLISDCAFYAEIFKLVAQQLANLPQLIANLLGLNSSEVSSAVAKSKRDALQDLVFARDEPVETLYTRDGEAILTSLMESLKSSGLANQVVQALVTEDSFYSWGASLIESLFKNNAISLTELISALLESGLIPSLIENFLNFDTLKTVVVTALAAAFGNCKDTTVSSTFATTPTATATPTVTTGTANLSTLTTFTGTPIVTGTLTTTAQPTLVTSTTTAKVCKKKRRRAY
ncbi:hypothetical protein KGF56_000527 [Candida oxycetoniae]|uniref:Opaque-phase-specific protein OP4 n=1 Tax=Candida oxycetoniae TaxID=497107 RepID=A0AAI9T0N0_9ASCO|nr:uncharacterized protein KGF56_000527 [Candida oxycetoniae]KAI3406681.2 hypothetical protein KGF56_000527 [Candida oxycetoniae]